MRATLCTAILLFALPAFAADTRPAAQPPTTTVAYTYTVWAFKLTDGKWVKDDNYCWTTTDPARGLDYARKVNAVAGWCATTNCPQPVLPVQGYANSGRLRRAASNFNPGYAIQTRQNPDGGQTIYMMGMAIRLGPGMVRNLGSGGAGNSSFYDSSPTYGNTEDVDNMVRTQDMINQQQMNNDTQDMINTQNMINTEQMINDQQNAINAQNLSNSFNPP